MDEVGIGALVHCLGVALVGEAQGLLIALLEVVGLEGALIIDIGENPAGRRGVQAHFGDEELIALQLHLIGVLCCQVHVVQEDRHIGRIVQHVQTRAHAPAALVPHGAELVVEAVSGLEILAHAEPAHGEYLLLSVQQNRQTGGQLRQQPLQTGTIPLVQPQLHQRTAVGKAGDLSVRRRVDGSRLRVRLSRSGGLCLWITIAIY